MTTDPPTSASVPLVKAVPIAYLALQGAGMILLVAGLVVLRVLQHVAPDRLTAFGASWMAVFVLVPVSFVPALVWWNTWVVRRFGKRPQAWRFTAEVAFALQVIACLIGQGIA
jgi:hypothetical protein